MFDLDINNYNRNELEDLLDLSNKKYTKEDLEILQLIFSNR